MNGTEYNAIKSNAKESSDTLANTPKSRLRPSEASVTSGRT